MSLDLTKKHITRSGLRVVDLALSNFGDQNSFPYHGYILVGDRRFFTAFQADGRNVSLRDYDLIELPDEGVDESQFGAPPEAPPVAPPSVDFSKPVWTLEGHRVKILSTEEDGLYPVIGLIYPPPDLISETHRWTIGGVSFNDQGFDSLTNKNPIPTTLHLNIWRVPNGELWASIFPTEGAAADHRATYLGDATLLAYKALTFKEGEGL